MANVYEGIDEKLSDWIGRQHVFFVATAPLSADGMVNCSPKGSDSFRVLGEREVAYQDLTGSGIETVAHLRENGRIVVMFCSFEGPPKIVRLHGRGSVITEGQPRFEELSALFPPNVGTRSYIVVAVDRVSDSCGYAVPLFEFKEERDVLDRWAETKGEEKLKDYRREKNAVSLDGLPGLEPTA